MMEMRVRGTPGKNHMIEVHLFGKLRAYGPSTPTESECVVHVPADGKETIADVLHSLGIDPADVAHLFLNHQYSALTRHIKDGDRLGVFGMDMKLLYRQYFPKYE